MVGEVLKLLLLKEKEQTVLSGEERGQQPCPAPPASRRSREAKHNAMRCEDEEGRGAAQAREITSPKHPEWVQM